MIIVGGVISQEGLGEREEQRGDREVEEGESSLFPPGK